MRETQDSARRKGPVPFFNGLLADYFMKTHRLARVAEVVREVAAETILFELQDPRIKGVTVTRAEVAADLQHAKVFVSLMGTQKEQDLCMHGLALGRLRSVQAGLPAQDPLYPGRFTSSWMRGSKKASK